jgi:hypothetical protein
MCSTSTSSNSNSSRQGSALLFTRRSATQILCVRSAYDAHAV